MFCDEMGQVALLDSFRPNFGRVRDALDKVSVLGPDFLYKYTFGPETATKNLEIEIKKKGKISCVCLESDARIEGKVTIFSIGWRNGGIHGKDPAATYQVLMTPHSA